MNKGYIWQASILKQCKLEKSFPNHDHSLLFLLFVYSVSMLTLFLSVNNRLCCKFYKQEMPKNVNLTDLLYLETQRQTLPELTGWRI